MAANVKFRCTLNDLIKVIEQQVGLTNIVVESGDDVDGLVNTLLGVLNCHCTKTKQGFSVFNGTDVTIHLFSKDYIYCLTDWREYEDKERQTVADRLFAQEAKKFQDLITHLAPQD